MYSVSLRRTFISLVCSSSLHFSRFSSTCSHCRSQHHLHTSQRPVSHLVLNLPITMPNKKRLVADAVCSPTATWNPPVTPTAHLSAVMLHSYMSCTSCFCVTQNHSSSKIYKDTVQLLLAFPEFFSTSLLKANVTSVVLFLWYETISLLCLSPTTAPPASGWLTIYSSGCC